MSAGSVFTGRKCAASMRYSRTLFWSLRLLTYPNKQHSILEIKHISYEVSLSKLNKTNRTKTKKNVFTKEQKDFRKGVQIFFSIVKHHFGTCNRKLFLTINLQINLNT